MKQLLGLLIGLLKSRNRDLQARLISNRSTDCLPGCERSVILTKAILWPISIRNKHPKLLSVI